MLASMDYVFSFSLVSGYIGASEVLDELLPPIGDRRRYCKYQLLGGGNFLNFLIFFDGWLKALVWFW